MKDFEKYNKEFNDLIESKEFKKLDIDEQFISMLEVANKYSALKRIKKLKINL